MDGDFIKERIHEMLENVSRERLEFVYWFLLRSCMRAI